MDPILLDLGKWAGLKLFTARLNKAKSSSSSESEIGGDDDNGSFIKCDVMKKIKGNEMIMNKNVGIHGDFVIILL